MGLKWWLIFLASWSWDQIFICPIHHQAPPYLQSWGKGVFNNHFLLRSSPSCSSEYVTLESWHGRPHSVCPESRIFHRDPQNSIEAWNLCRCLRILGSFLSVLEIEASYIEATIELVPGKNSFSSPKVLPSYGNNEETERQVAWYGWLKLCMCFEMVHYNC